jgi:thiamine biosynthesis lipoprotein
VNRLLVGFAVIPLLLACAPSGAPAPPQGHISGQPVPTGDDQKPTGEKLAISRHTVRAGQPSMGTLLECTVIYKDADRASRACRAMFEAAHEYERLFSTWLPSSALNRLSDAAGRGPQPVDARLARILIESADYSRRTGGAFDITVGPLVDLWRQAASKRRAPTDAALASALLRVGSTAITVNANGPTVDLARPGMRLDLGGIAKGWALDRMGELLYQGGIRDALLDFGQSSILARGKPFDAPDWTVGLKGKDGGLAGTLTLNDVGFSVSGSQGQSAEIDGVIYGHIIDPRTGLAATRNVQAAVVAPTATEAEAWSTALAVLGPDGLAAVERQEGVEAHLLLEDGSERITSGWAARVSYAPAF